ncbi:MAG: hypothetical protein M1812_004362 [Candelaria pacifica]|nr:MAG: hypothetical protein M1812_004362 [Candelaria pacifica]
MCILRKTVHLGCGHAGPVLYSRCQKSLSAGGEPCSSHACDHLQTGTTTKPASCSRCYRRIVRKYKRYSGKKIRSFLEDIDACIECIRSSPPDSQSRRDACDRMLLYDDFLRRATAEAEQDLTILWANFWGWCRSSTDRESFARDFADYFEPGESSLTEYCSAVGRKARAQRVVDELSIRKQRSFWGRRRWTMLARNW